MYGYNAEQPIAIPIYTVLPYCVIIIVLFSVRVVHFFLLLFIYFLHCLLSIVRTTSLLYYGVFREVDVA